jgi:hypothetical protein
MSTGWLIASGFRPADGLSTIRDTPSAKPLKRDLQLLIAGEAGDESHRPSNSSAANPDLGGTENPAKAVPELQRRSFAAERTMPEAAKRP